MTMTHTVSPLPFIDESDPTSTAAAFIESITSWIRTYFEQSKGKTAILGMSGGADSTICGALNVKALGSENVIGVFMPNGTQADIDDAHAAAEAAGITKTRTMNIGEAYMSLLGQAGASRDSRAGINLAPRIRMASLYLIAQEFPGGRVCCTGNLSEATVGYCTLYGDLAGDYAPISRLVKEDVCTIGDALGLPKHLVHKTPSDGLSGKSDEEKLGIRYDDIKAYIRHSRQLDWNTVKRISELTSANRFKSEIIRIPAWDGVNL